MIRAQVKINASLFKKLSELRQEIAKKGEATVQELSKLGKYYAQSHCYRDTGYTAKSIRRRSMITSSGPEARLFIDPGLKYRPNDGVHRGANSKGNFDLVRWSHTSAKARNHFKRPDSYRFMYKTREYLNSIKTGIAKGRFKTIKIQ